MITISVKKYLGLMIVAVSLFGFVFIAGAQTGTANSSVLFTKDPSSELFAITMKDSQGIRSFSLEARSKGSYGGDLGKCPNVRVIDQIAFQDPSDFDPFMNVHITDCDGNVDELEVSPPKNGIGKGVRKSRAEEVEEAPLEPSVEETKREEAQQEIEYPVADLGSCPDEIECRAYCDDADNIKMCVDFAESHGLMSSEEAQRARKFADTSPAERPGGCSDENECTIYCEDSSHIEECINFAEKHDFMPAEELAQAKKILPLIKSGQTPGGCKTKAQCELYCSEASHIEMCLSFAEENGLLPPEELAMAKKMVPLIKNGETPGGCTSKIQCEAYCSQLANMRKCLEFGEKHAIIPPEELAMAKKMMPLMEKGEMPGGCVSKQSCEEYCSGEGHMEECMAFAEKAGLMSKEEVEMAKKMGGKGPGGCRSKDQCEAYCMQNQEACMNWTQENGIETESGGLNGAGFSGPGGCKSQEECMQYCQTHARECQSFMPPNGQAEVSNQSEAVADCSPQGTVAAFVCGQHGQDAPPDEIVTYFNACTAEQHGADIIYEGVCIRGGQPDVPCADVADPVCGNDNHTWVSACYAEEKGGGVQYAGVCTGAIEKIQEKSASESAKSSSGGSGFNGPGGCTNPEECTAYCMKNPTMCQDLSPTGVQMNSQYQGNDLGTECAKRGGTWDGKTCQNNSGIAPNNPISPPSAPVTVPIGGQIPQEYCSSFAEVPSCSYVGAADSQNYIYCKQCFPDK